MTHHRLRYIPVESSVRLTLLSLWPLLLWSLSLRRWLLWLATTLEAPASLLWSTDRYEHVVLAFDMLETSRRRINEEMTKCRSEIARELLAVTADLDGFVAVQRVGEVPR